MSIEIQKQPSRTARVDVRNKRPFWMEYISY